MKILGIAFFFLAVLCVCTVGENGTLTTTVSENVSASTSKSVTEAVNGSTSQATTLQASVLATTAVRATNESITSNSTPPSPNATQQITQQITQDTTTQPPVKVTTTSADQSDSTTNTTQTSGTQLAQNESLDVSSTKGWSSSSTIFLQKTTSDPGTSGLHMRSPTESTKFSSKVEQYVNLLQAKKFGSHNLSGQADDLSDSPGSDSGKKKVTGIDIHYSSVILPVVITLIVITLSVFSLVALYRICQKKTPERQENGTEQSQSDKEGVKLLSVKTTSPETGYRWMPLGAGEEAGPLVFVEVRDIYEVGFSLPSANLSEPTTPPPSGEVSQGRTTGEHSSQGKNKTRQLFTPQQ